MREITKEIKYDFPIGVLAPDIKPFLVFSTHAQVPEWVTNKNPTYKVLLQNLQLVSYLPSLREFEPITFKGSESESQIGAQVAELKRKYNVENQYAIEWILYSGDIVLARDYLYNLRQVKYLNLKTPYLTPEIEAVAGFDFSTTLSIKLRGQNLLNDGVDYVYLTGWYTLLISYDEISIDNNFTDVNSKITTINNSIVTTNSALTSVNGSIIANNNNLITLWSGLNANTAKLGAVETKINTMQTAINSILFILENATFSPSPSPTPNPTPNPTPTPTPQNEDDMPYFATKQALIDNNATYTTGQSIILGENGSNLWVYYDSVSANNNNFTTDSDRLAFTYKTGCFLNISSPAYNGGFNLFKYVPAWIIDALLGKQVLLYSSAIVNESNEWLPVIIQLSAEPALPPIRTLFIENPTIEYSLIEKHCTVRVTQALSGNINNTNNVRDFMSDWLNNKLLPNEKVKFIFTNISNSGLDNPIQIECVGKEWNGYESYFTPYILCSGNVAGDLYTSLLPL